MKRTRTRLIGLVLCGVILTTTFFTKNENVVNNVAYYHYKSTIAPRTGQIPVAGEKADTAVNAIERPRPTRSSVSVCSTEKKNVLFLIVDDLIGDLPLRKDDQSLMSNGQKLHIPNLKRLAGNSVVFQAAYSQYPLGNPSRSSMLTGRRPETTHVYGVRKSFRTQGGNFTTIPEYFKDNGYHATGMGKVFYVCNNEPLGLKRDPQSWSEMLESGGQWDTIWREKLGGKWKAVPQTRRKQQPLPDETNVQRAIHMLQEYAENCRTFFLALGLYKPHEPIVFPEEMMDHYPLEEIKPPLILQPGQGMTSHALKRYNSLAYHLSANLNESLEGDGFNGDDFTSRWRQAYFSAVTYMDQLVGSLIDVLDDTGLATNTIVNLVSDHGVKMGEHGAWGKSALFDADTHVPWIMRIPGLTDGGIQVDDPVELIDVFPTLITAAGLPPVPTCPANSIEEKNCHEGMDLLSSLQNGSAPKRNRAAFSQVYRNDRMGFSIRTREFRYTEYVKFDYWHHRPIWNITNEAELYDHRLELGEVNNRFSDPDYANIRSVLQSQLRAGWRGQQ